MSSIVLSADVSSKPAFTCSIRLANHSAGDSCVIVSSREDSSSALDSGGCDGKGAFSGKLVGSTVGIVVGDVDGGDVALSIVVTGLAAVVRV